MAETKHGKLFELTEASRVLTATPATLRALLGGLTEDWLLYQPAPGEWSPLTVLVHLIHNERTNWMPRARVILSEVQVRQFPHFRQLPEEDRLEGAPVGQLLTQFADLRRESLSELQSLDLQPHDYERQAEHPVLGMVNLGQLLATWVVHDLNHLHQIAQTLARRYSDAVGPWKVNLAILEQ